MQHPTMMSVDVITSIEGAKEETETDVPDAPPSAGAPAASISSDPRPILNHSSHPPDSSLSSPHDSLPHSNLTSRAGSTGPSSVSPSNPPLAAVGSGSIEIQQDSSIISQAVPGTNKRRKLTSAEKEVRIFEKLQKDREKEIAAALRLEEKRRRDEEKAQRDAEKEQARLKREEEKAEKQRQKDEEKRLKDAEKLKKEEEIAKKSKAQLKLSFFATAVKSKPQSGSILPMHTTGVCPHPSARSQSPSKPAIISDYDRTFLPFSIPAHVTLAPHNRFDRDEASKEFVCNQLDDSFRRVTEEAEVEIDRSRSSTRTVNFTELCNISMSRRGRRGYDRQLPTSNEVNSQLGSRTSLLPALKYIYFHQDIRVPYIGTYTKLPLYRPLCSLGRNPFQRLRPDTCYEEDSEAEWEEPGEGEDLLSEADDDNSGNEEDEMEDFLDDEDDPGLQRRGAVKGELVPVCSGICWEDSNSTRDQGVIHLHRMDILLEGITGGIDPYSTTYWAAETSSMGPPHAPLVRQPSRVSPAMHEVSASTSGPTPGAVPASLRGKPLIDAHLMEDFKKEVDGSDMTKIAMVEHLKKRFRGVKQAILKDTLDVLAERVGNKVADRRWMLRPVEGADSEAELAPPGKVLTLVPMSMPVPRKDERVMVVVPAVVRPGAKAKKVLDLSKIEHVSS